MYLTNILRIVKEVSTVFETVKVLSRVEVVTVVTVVTIRVYFSLPLAVQFFWCSNPHAPRDLMSPVCRVLNKVTNM